MVSESSLGDFVGFLDQDYHYQSVATRIPLNDELALFCTTGDQTAACKAVTKPLHYAVRLLFWHADEITGSNCCTRTNNGKVQSEVETNNRFQSLSVQKLWNKRKAGNSKG